MKLKIKLLLCGAMAATAALADAAKKKPNIVFFLVDDMGWQDTSVPFWQNVDGTERPTFLNKRYRTPNMERLAARGVRFSHAYASPICSPSRCSLLTGMNAARHHVTNWTLNRDQTTDAAHPTLLPPEWSVNGLQPSGTAPSGTSRHPLTEEPFAYNMTKPYTTCTPLPALLRDAGYTTIHCGKAHWGAKDTPGANPKLLGFDTNIAGTEIGGPADYRGSQKYGSGPFHVCGLDENDYYENDVFLTEALTQEALKRLTEIRRDAALREKPFFLYMSHYAIHAPFDLRGRDKRFVDNYPDGALATHPADGHPWSANERRYSALIEGMDKSLGDLLDWLDAEKIADETIVVFMADNGGLAISGRLGDTLANYPLSHGKGSCHEGGIREPLIVSWPGVTQGGTFDTTPVLIEDFFPTLLDMAGADHPKTEQIVDGVSLVPALKRQADVDGATSLPKERELLFHVPNFWGEGAGRDGYGPASALIVGDWKLIYAHDTRKLSLYNLADDIGETRDLASEQPDRVRDMASRLTAQLKAKNAQMPRMKDGTSAVGD